MSAPARLRVYRFDPGAAFEGGLVGALERLELVGDAKLLDALFLARDASSGALEAVRLGAASGDDRFVALLEFRLDPGRRRALTEATLAEHPEAEAVGATLEAGASILAALCTGGAPAVLDDAVERAGGRLVADEPADARDLAHVGARLRHAAAAAP